MRFRGEFMVGGALLLLLVLSFVVTTESLHHSSDHDGDDHGTTGTVRLDRTGRREDSKKENVRIGRSDRHYEDGMRKSHGFPHPDKNNGPGTGTPRGVQNLDREINVTKIEHVHRLDRDNGEEKKTHRPRRPEHDSFGKKIQHDEITKAEQFEHSEDSNATNKTEGFDHSDDLKKSRTDRIRRTRNHGEGRKFSRRGRGRKIERLNHTEGQDVNSNVNDKVHRPRHHGAKRGERLDRHNRHYGGRKTDRHMGMRKANRLDNRDQQDGVKSTKHLYGHGRRIHRHSGIRKADRHVGGIRVLYPHIKRTKGDNGIRKIDRYIRKSDSFSDVKHINQQGRARNVGHQDGGVKKSTVQDGVMRKTHRHGGKKIDPQGGARKTGDMRTTREYGEGKSIDQQAGARKTDARKTDAVRKIDGHDGATKSSRHDAVRSSLQRFLPGTVQADTPSEKVIDGQIGTQEVKEIVKDRIEEILESPANNENIIEVVVKHSESCDESFKMHGEK